MSRGVKEPMGKIFIAIVVSMVPACVVAAEQSTQPPRKPATGQTLRPPEVNPCAAYGAGFVKVEGTSTCIKIGGSVRIEGGVNGSR